MENASDDNTEGRTAQGSPVQDTNGNQKNPSSGPDVDKIHRPSYTFIEHKDNLTTKRICDPEARKAIRSHVMRDVRFREKQIGKRRGQKRENASKQKRREAELSCSSISDSASSEDSSPRTEDLSPKTSQSKSPSDSAMPWEESGAGTLTLPQVTQLPPTHLRATCSTVNGFPTMLSKYHDKHLSLRYRAPSVGFIDPFHALPGDSSHSQLIQRLLRHCVNVFLPSLFFVQTGTAVSKQNAVISSVVQTLRAEPACFYAVLTVAAAHRSLLQGRRHVPQKNECNPDPTFHAMEGKAIQEFNKKLSGPKKLENSSFEAILALVGATTLVGDFDRTQLHLDGLAKMVKARGGVDDSFFTTSAFVRNTSILNDLKAALVLNSRPLFPLYVRSPRPEPSVIQRLLPPVDSMLFDIGTKFRQIPQLVSSKLMDLIEDLRIILFLSDLGLRNGRLAPDDEQLFSRKSFEFEHDLLEYPYSDSITNGVIHPIEEIVRTALLCLSNTSLIRVVPGAALRRAAVSHLIDAISAISCNLYQSLQEATLDLLIWALYIGVDGACGQPEEESLLQYLDRFVARQPSMGFMETVRRCCGFFYVPSSMENGWRETWGKVKKRVDLRPMLNDIDCGPRPPLGYG